MTADTGRVDSEGAGSPLALLLEVQAHDVLLDQLAYRRRELEERRALAHIDQEIGVLEARAVKINAELSDLSVHQAEIESQVSTISSRIGAIEARLRQGGAFREIQAMSEETESLARHRRELEDRELEIMEQIEPVEGELAAIEGQLEALRGEREAAATALTDAETAVDSEAAGMRSEREHLVAQLPEALASDYERLRGRLGGIGAARLVDGACSGCHLRLPSSERERLLHAAPGEIVHCDQCGRILVA